MSTDFLPLVDDDLRFIVHSVSTLAGKNAA